MGDSYTILWPQLRCRLLQKHWPPGEPLTALYGGPHSSATGFARYGVKAGDFIYPVMVLDKTLFILGRIKVSRLITIDEYIADNPLQFAGLAQSQAEKMSALLSIIAPNILNHAISEENVTPTMLFNAYVDQHPIIQGLVGSCVTQVAIGEHGTSLSFDITVPPDILESIRYRSLRGERPIKHIHNGKLTNTSSIQGGYYRLSEASAKDFEAILSERI